MIRGERYPNKEVSNEHIRARAPFLCSTSAIHVSHPSVALNISASTFRYNRQPKRYRIDHDKMCVQEIRRFKCGHKEKGELRTCGVYDERVARRGFLRRLLGKPLKCYYLAHVIRDIYTVCSVACANRRKELRMENAREWRKQEKELQNREMSSHKRAQATASEYRRRKNEDEEVLRLWQEERKEMERQYKEKTLGKSRAPNPQSPIQPAEETAGSRPVVYTRPSNPAMLSRSHPARVNLRRAPPRLAERAILPQTSEPQTSGPGFLDRLHPARVNLPRERPQLGVRREEPEPQASDTPAMLDRSHPARVNNRRAPPPRLGEQRAQRQATPAEATSPASTRVEAQRAPPRLAHRQLPPQASRAGSSPNPQSPRTQANSDAPGRPPQGTQRQLRIPFLSTKKTPSPLSRSNGRHLRRDDAGTLNDPRTRIQAAARSGQGQAQARQPAVQSVAGRRPVAVSRPADVPQPSRARVSPDTLSRPTASSRARTTQTSQPSRSQGQSRPPVPPKDKPVVPRNEPWRPQNPDLVPRPLTISPKPAIPPKAAERALRTPAAAPIGNLPGFRADTTRTVPARRPVGGSATQERPQPGAATGSNKYKPNPMFANKQERKPAAGEVSDARRRPAAAAKPKESSKKDMKPGWFKRLVSNKSAESVEWVSEDAARIERGPSRGPSRGPNRMK